MNRTGLFLFIAVVILAVAAYWFVYMKPKTDAAVVDPAATEGTVDPAAAPVDPAAAPVDPAAAPAEMPAEAPPADPAAPTDGTTPPAEMPAEAPATPPADAPPQ